MSPILALRAAILARIEGDPELAALMGGSVRLHDEAPRGAEPVFALWGEAAARDASTPEARAHDHAIEIVVQARPGSAASALAAAERLASLLDDAPLAPPGHHLVSLRVAGIEATRDPRTGLARTMLRLAARTESL